MTGAPAITVNTRSSARPWRGPAMSEAMIQRAVCQHLTLRKRPGVAWFAVPNGGSRDRREAARMKGEGVKAGAPDLVIVADGRFLGLELKTEAGRLSSQQHQIHGEIKLAGGEVAVAFGLDEALKQLDAWGVTK